MLQINARSKPNIPLVDRLISISHHYILMTKIQEMLTNFILNYSDPHVNFNFKI